MATWRETVQDETYKKLSMSDRTKTKDEFFKYKISQSAKYKTLSAEKQKSVKKDFFTIRKEEGLEPDYSRKPTFKNILKIAGEEFQKRSKPIDKPVEEIAKFIEPDTVKPGFLGGAEFFARQGISEVARAYKPSVAGTFGLASKAIKPIAKVAGKAAVKLTPKVVKKALKPVGKFLTQNLTVGKGKPKAYQAAAREAELERAIGGREAEKVGQVLSTDPATGKALSREKQRYVGRIFRKEIDTSGKKILTPEKTDLIQKRVSAEVAFSPKVQSLQSKLKNINSELATHKRPLSNIEGKVFMSPTGKIEQVTGIKPKAMKFTKSGKPLKRRGFEPVAEPVIPTKGQVPQEMFPENQIIRSAKQVREAPTLSRPDFPAKKNLLAQRKQVSKQLETELMDIEVRQRAEIGDIFKEDFQSLVAKNPKYQALKAISDEGRVIQDKWSAELAKSGIPKEETAKIIEENIGSYMARKYTSKLKPESEGPGFFKNLKLSLNNLKRRKDLSEQVRKSMGEIKEPALPTAIAVKQTSTNIANNKLFSTVAKNPEWVADTNITGNLIKMGDGPSLGALKGKWVVPEIAQDINAITQMGQQSQGIYLKALSAWKFGKVVLNPAAQARNALSNTILLDLSGTNHIRQAKLYPKAFKAYRSKGKLYTQALDDGALGGEFVGTETMKKLQVAYENTAENNLQKWMNVAKTPFKKAGELYQGMEQVSKMVKYMDVLEKTGNRKLAAAEAQKWLFDYNKIPKFVEVLRKSPIGAPFITFTYKAIPRIAEALVNRPMALYKYKALADAFNETSRKYQGMDPVAFAREKESLPKWVMRDIGGMPTNLLLPWKDKYGRTQWLNLEYILPVGQAPEIAEKGLGGIVSNPAFNITADIIKNTDFKGSQIIPPEATKKEAAEAIAMYVYRQLAPSLAPGGYSAEKIRAGFAKEPERFNPERTREAIPALLDTMVGLKINPVDVDQADMFKMFDKDKRLKALDKQFYTIVNNPILSEEKKDKMIDNIFNKKMKVMNE